MLDSFFASLQQFIFAGAYRESTASATIRGFNDNGVLNFSIVDRIERILGCDRDAVFPALFLK